MSYIHFQVIINKMVFKQRLVEILVQIGKVI